MLAIPPAQPTLPPGGADRTPVRDALWEHCRNSLGIARLLVQERRPAALVATACHTAAEAACRAALWQARLPFDGDLDRTLARLHAPAGLWSGAAGLEPAEQLAAAGRVVAWAAAYLRAEVPERRWGY